MGQDMVGSRRVGDSSAIVSQLMLPADANPTGNIHGGTIMKLVDTVGGVVAMRHCRRRTATARIDEMSFLHPVYVGDLVTLKASVNDVGRTSMEVGVRVEAENLHTGEERHVASAYLVYVALDDDGCPTEAPRLIVETEGERKRMEEAKVRRARRQRPREAEEIDSSKGRRILPVQPSHGVPRRHAHLQAKGRPQVR